jgi:hypothetical protein
MFRDYFHHNREPVLSKACKNNKIEDSRKGCYSFCFNCWIKQMEFTELLGRNEQSKPECALAPPFFLVDHPINHGKRGPFVLISPYMESIPNTFSPRDFCKFAELGASGKFWFESIFTALFYFQLIDSHNIFRGRADDPKRHMERVNFNQRETRRATILCWPWTCSTPIASARHFSTSAIAL